MNAEAIVPFVAVVVRSGAALLPATLGVIVTERSGATNLGVEGVMAFSAMAAYGIALATGDPYLGAFGGALLGGVLCLTHALPVVRGRAGPEQQFILGLVLVVLGDALSRLFGRLFVGQRAPALDERLVVPLLGSLPWSGEALFQQRALVYVAYLLAVVVSLALEKTRVGLHLRAIGDEPSAADSVGVDVDRYRFCAIVLGGMLMGFSGALLSLSTIGAWTDGLTGGRGWIALGLVTFSGWSPRWAIAGSLLFGGFEAAQFRLPPAFPGSQYIWGAVPYLAPIVALPFITGRVSRRRSAAPSALGQPYIREERG
ncbi:MAG: ABC transporter permease [Chloroflexi bacterium]|nr:ABC transporter permease [Chloroflexota bacterium]